jgi:hypothetical protein
MRYLFYIFCHLSALTMMIIVNFLLLGDLYMK